MAMKGQGLNAGVLDAALDTRSALPWRANVSATKGNGAEPLRVGDIAGIGTFLAGELRCVFNINTAPDATERNCSSL
jgi:hypothetical protein